MKIICVGRNYAEHAAELGDTPPEAPLLFGKFTNTLVEPGEPIVLPREATHVDAEGELGVEIGHGEPAGSPSRTRSSGARLPLRQRRVRARHPDAEGQWTRAKGFDRFARSERSSYRCRSSATAAASASCSG